jgi:SulP family sulfate permease
MALVLLLVPGLVGYVAMPSLAALLILAGSRTIRFSEGLSIWRTRWTSRLAVITTFFATLFLPIQVAVGIGAALSAIFHLNEASSDIVLVEQIRWPDGRMEERKPPKQLPSDRVTVLDVYGSLFYAGAWTLARSLPSPQGAVRPVVVLRLRGRASIGATLIDVLSDYAERLQRAGGRLYLSGVQGQVLHQLIRTNKLDVQGPVAVYQATNILGESTGQATLDADTWLLSRQAQASSSSPDNAPEP